MNQIRDCAKAPNVASVTSDELLDEHARELSEDCWRRNDLICYGRFVDDWGLKTAALGTANADKYHRIFPVPLDVMKLNKHWAQNNDY